MRSALIVAILTLAGPAFAEDPKPAPSQSSATDMAKIQAVLKQIQEGKNHFDFSPPTDSEPVEAYAPVLPKADDASPVATMEPDASAVRSKMANGLHPAKTEIRIPLKDRLRDVGIDTGPVDVDIRGKGLVLSIKY